MKRSKLAALLLATIALVAVSCRGTYSESPSGSGRDLEGSWSKADHYQEMLNAEFFAFGGVGFAGTASPGELGFRQVLTGPDAAKRFNDAYSDATDAGKLYVLCGLRATDRSAFNRCVVNLRLQTNQVMTMSGCIGNQEPIRKVVQRIVNGDYDSYFKRTFPRTTSNESDLRIQY